MAQRPAQSFKPRPTLSAWAAQIELLAGDKSSGMTNTPRGQASRARFADPFGLAIDRGGNLYVADAGENNRIRKITPGGMVTTLAGAKEGFADGKGAAAAFNTPSGLAIDAAGNLYVADTGNNAIRKISPQGQVSTLAGDGKAGYRDGPANTAQFNGPLGVAVDKNGKVYVADSYNDRIRVIDTDGQMQTLAGGAAPGDQDGPAQSALFDTPCALAVDAKGELFIADTGNHAIRKLSNSAQVTTLARASPEERWALLRKPLGLVIAPGHDGMLYVSAGAHGRILQISPKGVVRGLSGIGIDMAPADGHATRLKNPAGIVLDRSGGLYVADSGNFGVLSVRRQIAPTPGVVPGSTGVPSAVAPISPTVVPAASAPAKAPRRHPAIVKIVPFPWPLTPQNKAHDIAATLGEVRGNDYGESRDHLHGGIDIPAALGTAVLAVTNEKVSSPLANWGLGKLWRVRVNRGTRFRIGDVLGSVNWMCHVHLEMAAAGGKVNPLTLGLHGFKDKIAPSIETIRLFDAAWQPLIKKRANRLLVPANPGQFSIVVDAYDQIDSNPKHRRLGVYKLGYQILQADGNPLPGYEQPLINLEFNRLPRGQDAVKIAYAADSGITAYGSDETRFLYIVTNTVRDGHAKIGIWRAADLLRGDYTIRIFAADFAGNEALVGRDLAITIE